MKKVLVTGANGGLGFAVSKYFAENGFFVYRTDVKKGEELENTRQIICDLTDGNQIELLKEEILKETDTLYAVINLAGVFNMDSLIEIEEEKFKKIYEINLFGTFKINKAFFPLYRNGGRVLIVTSELAPLYPLPFESVYGLTKSALDDYANALRMELNLLNIPVSVIRPGAIETELLGASTAALDRLCEKTELYSYNANKFKKIVQRTESKAVKPEKVAKVIFKAATAKKPKFTYSINANKGLKLLNILPKKLQVYVIKKILKEK